MENEIKVNEYVRTKQGDIAKVIEYRDEIVLDKEIKFHGIYRGYICEDEIDFIVKHSSNLIDLIQCGDYVNGHLVIDIPGDGSGAVYLEQITKGALISTLKEDIRTIVTKEMMESISYKVKE